MTYTERFEHALVAACRWHATQTRKGSDVPYIAHLLAVAALAIEYGGDEDEAIAALLHDVVEDAGGLPTVASIRQQFGDRVTSIVLECTDTHETPKPPWRARKESYITSLSTASASARFVSCCDKLHNARSIVHDLRQIGDEVWLKFAGSKPGTLWYFTALLAEYQLGAVCPPLVEELQRTMDIMLELSPQPNLPKPRS